MMAATVLAALTIASPAAAQLGGLGKAIGKAQEVKSKADEWTFSDQEEQELGSKVSAMLRERYGVVQDRAVHKYVTLVGSLLASESSRPNLKWTFIVLDTDGINAFAAPGGFVHITRGALALITNEGELADVLAHEISHVTDKHAIRAIQKAKTVSAAGQATGQDRINQAADRVYDVIFENGFDRGDEMEADRDGLVLASKLGYTASGLGAFLTRLSDRNKNLTDRSGMFASHPETKARLDAMTKQIASQKLGGTALVAPRYAENVSFKPTPVDAVGQTAAASPAETKSSGKMGLASGFGALGREKSNDKTISSAGSRGVNPDRDAKGGPNKTLVSVTVTPAELAAFRKGIAG
jgi:predicted Zn-dependent protease